MDKYKAAKQYNDRFTNAKKRLDARINNQQQNWTPNNASANNSYDPTLHLAEEMIHVAHSGNQVKVQLIKYIDGKHNGAKTLFGYTDEHHHLLTMTLPLNDAQYRIIKKHAKNW